MSYAYRQWYVAVFQGDRATDLLAVFIVVATDPGEAIQQAWNYVGEQWHIDPQTLEYKPLPLPVLRKRGQQRNVTGCKKAPAGAR